MDLDRFPLGKPINRPGPAKHCPERKEIRPGIFEVDGKLQTDLPINGPQYAPAPPITTEQWDAMIAGGITFTKDPEFPIELWGTW